MHPSAACRALIAGFESCAKHRPDGRLDAYPDPGPTGLPWTIGFGTTGPGITRGTIWTVEQAEAALTARIDEAARAVTRVIGAAPTTQNQFDALVDFTYNCGSGAFASSDILRLHVAGQHAAAAEHFLHYTRGGGVVLAGLVRRRKAEAALYLS